VVANVSEGRTAYISRVIHDSGDHIPHLDRRETPTSHIELFDVFNLEFAYLMAKWYEIITYGINSPTTEAR
jgi:hypothetical protein